MKRRRTNWLTRYLYRLCQPNIIHFSLTSTARADIKSSRSGCYPTQALQALRQQQHGGAVALISGRSMVELDALTHPYQLPLADCSGAERRDINGKTHIVTLPDRAAQELDEQLRAALERCQDVSWNTRHERLRCIIMRRRRYQSAAYRWRRVVKRYPILALRLGECVVEIKPRGVNGGNGATFMQEGRRFQGVNRRYSLATI